ncbi:MAG: hypothetical protein F4064_00630 [Acidimicrobiales bacterium]|nr:hypothetical protein [Acidimicrobiia bacterium]MYI26577.1 hypothetical protein [Acidimicrobiales bacterium]
MLWVSALAIAGSIAIGNACTALLRQAAEGPPDRMVRVEYRPDAMNDARYSPRQVLLHIGGRCITGTSRDDTEYLLLFENGRELVEADGSLAITGVYRPDPTLLRPATTAAEERPRSSVSSAVEDSDRLWVDPHGSTVRRDSGGFWIGPHGEESSIDGFASEGPAESGDVILTSVRAVGHPGMRWLTTPHPECDQYPHAWIPDGLPT